MPPKPHITVYSCPKCNWADFHPVESCPRCHTGINESTFTGEGRVATYTVIRYPPKGFERMAPYIVALIDIDNGPRVIGRVSAKAEQIEIGSAVTLSDNRNGMLEFQERA